MDTNMLTFKALQTGPDSLMFGLMGTGAKDTALDGSFKDLMMSAMQGTSRLSEMLDDDPYSMTADDLMSKISSGLYGTTGITPETMASMLAGQANQGTNASAGFSELGKNQGEQIASMVANGEQYFAGPVKEQALNADVNAQVSKANASAGFSELGKNQGEQIASMVANGEQDFAGLVKEQALNADVNAQVSKANASAGFGELGKNQGEQIASMVANGKQEFEETSERAMSIVQTMTSDIQVAHGVAMDRAIGFGNSIAASAEQINQQSMSASAYQQVAGSIAENLQKGAKEFAMQLNPESLGKIDVSLKIHKGKLTIGILAASEETQKLLISQADRLVKVLGLSNIHVDGVQVDSVSNDKADGFGMSQDAYQNQGLGYESSDKRQGEQFAKRTKKAQPSSPNGEIEAMSELKDTFELLKSQGYRLNYLA